MKEPFEELRARLNRESAESDAKLLQFIREGTTEDQLREDWDQLRGVGSPRVSAQSGQLYWWREFLAALWAAHIPQKLATGVSIGAVLLVGWLILRPGGIPLRSDRTWQVAGLRLPNEMRIKVGGGLLLSGDKLRLEAVLGEGKRGATDDVQAYQIHFEAQTSSGETVRFNGTLLVTNTPGTTSIRSKRDILGAVLAGEWQVGLLVTNMVSPPFVP